MGRFDDVEKMVSGDGPSKAKASKKPAKPKSPASSKAESSPPAAENASAPKKRTYVHIGDNTALGKAAREVLDTLPPGFDNTPVATIISRFLADHDETVAKMLKDFYQTS